MLLSIDFFSIAIPVLYLAKQMMQIERKYSVLTTSTSVRSFTNGGIISEQKQTYKHYTLVRPTVTRPVSNTLDVLSLNNQLYMAALAAVF